MCVLLPTVCLCVCKCPWPWSMELSHDLKLRLDMVYSCWMRMLGNAMKQSWVLCKHRIWCSLLSHLPRPSLIFIIFHFILRDYIKSSTSVLFLAVNLHTQTCLNMYMHKQSQSHTYWDQTQNHENVQICDKILQKYFISHFHVSKLKRNFTSYSENPQLSISAQEWCCSETQTTRFEVWLCVNPI